MALPTYTGVYPYRLTTLAPWAWHGLAVPSGTATLNNVVTDTAMAFAVASALGMMPPLPCLPVRSDYRGHLAAMPYMATLFLGHDNQLMRPLARRLNLDAESGMPKSVHTARSSGNVKDYFHIQEVPVGSVFDGSFLHADPLYIAQQVCGLRVPRLVVRLGLGRNGVGLLERRVDHTPIHLNLHTVRLFDPETDIEAQSYLLHNIQPSQALEPKKALSLTMDWFGQGTTLAS